MSIASINPANGETFATFPALTAAAIEQRVSLARSAFERHRTTSYRERAELLFKAADILEQEAERFGALMTAEMGKTLVSAIAEAKKCALGCRYYAENGERFLADEVVETTASRSFIRYQPLGVVLAIMPWNFPFWQVFRFAAPAIMAGNVGLLKHSSNVPQCALAIEEIWTRAGCVPGVFQTLLIEAKQVEGLVDDPRVAAATLTGSEPAGQSVASRAGRQIKKTVLELGGSDPFIVLPSTDVAATAKAAVGARTINNGQSCIAAKRFIVAGEIYDEFETRFVEGMQALRIGDPMLPETEVGPLATAKIREELHDQVLRATESGATLLTGGNSLPGQGNFYAPTVLSNVPRTSPVFREEFFGPVAMIFRVKNVAEAIALANDSPFGLGSSVWTQDPAEMEACINEIEAGQVFVNSPVASDPRLPFGGVKRSGFGRELSAIGIREFVNVKTVWCK
ncbi:MAG TPA: NAD-dependent succinate-semialdehyde dehydrogenase [Bryobacteraceae bacterium]|jgi:succinate-semialdehyde dehydrogenase/glutarate-semialdehyde dehydrogenase|nr:NAD-dependent succinate-semialdehyde dehydrogenase [Bryobacteraceae bacterium]